MWFKCPNRGKIDAITNSNTIQEKTINAQRGCLAKMDTGSQFGRLACRQGVKVCRRACGVLQYVGIVLWSAIQWKTHMCITHGCAFTLCQVRKYGIYG